VGLEGRDLSTVPYSLGKLNTPPFASLLVSFPSPATLEHYSEIFLLPLAGVLSNMTHPPPFEAFLHHDVEKFDTVFLLLPSFSNFLSPGLRSPFAE